MDCFRCGRGGDYDRITVKRSSGTVEGGLCVACETSWLNGHAEPGGCSMAVCFGCGGEPEFVFPKWDSIVASENGSGPVEAEYRVTLTTPGSCSACLRE